MRGMHRIRVYLRRHADAAINKIDIDASLGLACHVEHALEEANVEVAGSEPGHRDDDAKLLGLVVESHRREVVAALLGELCADRLIRTVVTLLTARAALLDAARAAHLVAARGALMRVVGSSVFDTVADAARDE